MPPVNKPYLIMYIIYAVPYQECNVLFAFIAYWKPYVGHSVNWQFGMLWQHILSNDNGKLVSTAFTNIHRTSKVDLGLTIGLDYGLEFQSQGSSVTYKCEGLMFLDAVSLKWPLSVGFRVVEESATNVIIVWISLKQNLGTLFLGSWWVSRDWLFCKHEPQFISSEAADDATPAH